MQNVFWDIIDKFEKIAKPSAIPRPSNSRFWLLFPLHWHEPPRQASTQGERHWKLEE